MANKIIKGCGHHHIALYSADYDKSYKFYTEALGFSPICSWEMTDGRVSMLDVGDGSILELFESGRLKPKSETKEIGRYWHLCYKADDVDAAYQIAMDAGAISSQPPMNVDLDAKPQPFTIRNAFVFGPDGESIEFFKYM